jgi:GNAT superfamily N-acetyltransferase
MLAASSETERVAVPATTEADIALRRGTTDDFASVADLSRVVYGLQRSSESIRWLYQNNPAGPCAFWLSEDRLTRRVVALRPVFPWRLSVRGREIRAAQAGDAMTHPDYRGRGLFTALVRAAWSALRDDNVPLGFSFSNPGSLSVYRKIVIGRGPRAGTHVVLQFRRMVFPLSLRLARERFGAPARLVNGLDVAYRAFRRQRWMPAGHLSAFRVERFDSEFDELWRRTSAQFGVLTVRDSRYLNWRFIDSPSGRYQVIGLRSRGTLIGYVAFEIDDRGTGSIADLFGSPDSDVIGALLSVSLSRMLAAGCLKASLWTAAESELFAVVKRFGFIPRDDSFPMAVHVFQDGPEAAAALDGRQWLAWFGDRDVEHLVSPAATVSQ